MHKFFVLFCFIFILGNAIVPLFLKLEKKLFMIQGWLMLQVLPVLIDVHKKKNDNAVLLL